jgi:hypothetical protein
MARGNLPRYYRVDKTGRARWEPTRAMRELGFKTQQLGPDGDRAWAQAEVWNTRWDAARRGHKASDEAILAAGWAPDEVDDGRAYVTLMQIEAIAERFKNSAAAAQVVKGMRKIATDLDRAAKLAAANAVPRDVLRVAS